MQRTGGIQPRFAHFARVSSLAFSVVLGLVSTLVPFSSPAVHAAITPDMRPGLISATAVSTSVIELLWKDTSFNESSFLIQQQINGTFQTIGTLPSYPGTGTTVTTPVDGLATASTYTFRVCATKFNSSPDCSASKTATTQGSQGVAAPTNVTWERVGAGTVRVNWQHRGTGVSDFKLFVLPPRGTWIDYATLSADTRSADVVPVAVQANYQAQVCARNAAGVQSCASPVNIYLQQGF